MGLCAAVIAGSVGVARSTADPTRAGSETQWYWTVAHVQDTLRELGIDWSDLGHHAVLVARCAGLGRSVDRGGVQHFHDLHCYIKPRNKRVYKIVFHVLGERTYRYAFAGYQTKQQWWWSPQYAADALVQAGIRWPRFFDAVTASTCSAFGPSSRIRGTLYYKLFFCTVAPASGRPYSIVMDVDARYHDTPYFVDYSNEIAVTPTDPTPSPSSNTTTEDVGARIVDSQQGLMGEQDAITRLNQSRWGTNTAPSGASILTGAAVPR